MTEHVLYKPSDFSYDDESYLSDIVINGGLSVCKHCGAYESGLDEYPTCEEWRNRVIDCAQGGYTSITAEFIDANSAPGMS